MRLKELRGEKNLSQQKLAEIAGVAQSTVHYIETGQNNPTYKVLKKIAKALDVPVSILLDDNPGMAVGE